MDTEGLDLVAGNDIGEADDIEYLLTYDTVYGRYNKTVEVTSDAGLLIGGRRLTLLCEKDPARLPWKSLNVDILFECTGRFTTCVLSTRTFAPEPGTSSFRRRRTTTMSTPSSTE